MIKMIQKIWKSVRISRSYSQK